MNRVVGRAAAVPGFGQLVQRARNPRRQGAFWDARRAFFGESHREKFIFPLGFYTWKRRGLGWCRMDVPGGTQDMANSSRVGRRVWA